MSRWLSILTRSLIVQLTNSTTVTVYPSPTSYTLTPGARHLVERSSVIGGIAHDGRRACDQAFGPSAPSHRTYVRNGPHPYKLSVAGPPQNLFRPPLPTARRTVTTAHQPLRSHGLPPRFSLVETAGNLTRGKEETPASHGPRSCLRRRPSRLPAEKTARCRPCRRRRRQGGLRRSRRPAPATALTRTRRRRVSASRSCVGASAAGAA